MYIKKKKQKPSYIGLIAIMALVVIAFFGFKLWTGLIHPDKDVLTEAHINGLSFNGRVEGFKYDDNRKHAKIAILSDGSRYDIYELWVYEIDAGDTLIKKKDSMQIEVRKPHGKVQILDYWPIIRKLELTGRL